MSKSVQLIIKRGLYTTCGVLVILDAIFLRRSSHFASSGPLAMDGWPGFYAGVGLIGSGLLIVLVWGLRRLLSASDTYDTHDD